MHVAGVTPMHSSVAINVRFDLSDMRTVARGQARSVTTRYVSTGTGGRRKTQAMKLSSFTTTHQNLPQAHMSMHAELLETEVSHPPPRHHRLQTTTTHRLQLALSQEEERSPYPDRNHKSTTLRLRSAPRIRSPEHLYSLIS